MESTKIKRLIVLHINYNTVEGKKCRSVASKLQALVYDILPSATAVFSFAIGSRKLSDNERFFVGAQTVASLFQTNSNYIIIRLTMLFTPAHIKPTLFESGQNSLFSFLFLFLPCVVASHVYVRAWALGCFCSTIPTSKDVVNQCLEFGLSHISTRTYRRGLTALVDSCAEIKSAPSVA